MAPVRKTKTAATARPMANAERRLADTHLATAKRAAEIVKPGTPHEQISDSETDRDF